MKSYIMKALLVFTAALACVAFSACGDENEDDRPEGGEIKPTTNVDDPAGTIEISMRKEGQGTTRIDNIYINESDNFTLDSYGYIASYGTVNGLGNVSNIPVTGWAREVTVKPGYGYVAYDEDKDRFYRLYVSDYIASVAGGVIGAEVKYQKPFLGKDETVKLDEEALTFKAEGGEQSLVTNNGNVVLFGCSTDVDWLHVSKSSTRDYAFLTDGITVRCDPSNSTSSSTGTITLTTAYKKTTTIKVTRLGSAPYLSLAETQREVASNEQTVVVPISTNYDLADLSVSGAPSWLSAEIIDATYEMRQKARKIKFVGGERRASANDESGAQSYELQLRVQANYQTAARSATLTVKSADGKKSGQLKLTQKGMSIELSPAALSVDASAGTSSVQVNAPFAADELQAKSSASWCSVTLGQSGSKVVLNVKRTDNTTYKAREATVTLTAEGSDATATLNVTQSGITIANLPSDVWFDRQSGNYTVSLAASIVDWTLPKSNQTWCTVSKNGYQLTIRCEATNEDRVATLTFSGSSYKIKVHQSKYAVGDDYAEGNVTGKVSYMDYEGTRVISCALGEYQWSTETVSTGATDQYDGTKNMAVIKKIPNWQTLYPAFAAVDGLNADGVKGWYLPAVRELISFVTHYGGAWSSTEESFNYAYYSNFGSTLKESHNRVIAIRKF